MDFANEQDLPSNGAKSLKGLIGVADVGKDLVGLGAVVPHLHAGS